MYNFILSAILVVMMISESNAQTTSDKQAVESVIRQFVQGGDERNEKILESVLHAEHRVILSRFKGSNSTTILSRDAYLTMVKTGKIGGEKRSISIQTIDVSDHTASSKVLLETEKQRFTSYYLLVKDKDNWQLISDMPVVENR